MFPKTEPGQAKAARWAATANIGLLHQVQGMQRNGDKCINNLFIRDPFQKIKGRAEGEAEMRMLHTSVISSCQQ